MSETSLPHEFQYSSADHQAETAISGMWLFLATEMLFFGAIFLAWIYCRHWNQAGFDAGAQHTQLAIGTINTVILLTSSLVYSLGVAFIEAGNNRRLIQCCAVVWALGFLFLILKFGLEYYKDFARSSFPRSGFCHQWRAQRRSAALLRLLFRQHGAPRRPHDRRPRFGRMDHLARQAQ